MLLCLLLKGFSVALALDVQLVVLEPKELEESDLPRLSELTFFVLLVAVLLQSATRKQAINLLPSFLFSSLPPLQHGMPSADTSNAEQMCPCCEPSASGFCRFRP